MLCKKQKQKSPEKSTKIYEKTKKINKALESTKF